MRVVGVYLRESTVDELDEMCPVIEEIFPELGNVSRSDAIRFAIVRGLESIREEVYHRRRIASERNQ